MDERLSCEVFPNSEQLTSDLEAWLRTADPAILQERFIHEVCPFLFHRTLSVLRSSLSPKEKHDLILALYQVFNAVLSTSLSPQMLAVQKKAFYDALSQKFKAKEAPDFQETKLPDLPPIAYGHIYRQPMILVPRNLTVGVKRKQEDFARKSRGPFNHLSPTFQAETISLRNSFSLNRSGSEPTLVSCDDIAGVLLGKDGKVKRFAVADGVGSSLAGGSVANNAVQASLLVQPCDKCGIGERFMKKLIFGVEAAIRGSFDRNQFLKRAMEYKGHDISRTLIDLKILKDYPASVGSTVLLTGLVDNEELHLALVGDCGFFVLDPNFRCIGSGMGRVIDGAPMQICVGRDGFNIITYRRIPFKKGSRAFAFSDGFLKGQKFLSIPELGMRASELLQGGLSSEEAARQLFLEVRNHNDGYSDDILLLEVEG